MTTLTAVLAPDPGRCHVWGWLKLALSSKLRGAASHPADAPRSRQARTAQHPVSPRTTRGCKASSTLTASGRARVPLDTRVLSCFVSQRPNLARPEASGVDNALSPYLL
eukprot:2348383-Rhodomonas_salina.1